MVPAPGACAQEDKMQEEEKEHRMEAQVVTAECTVMISDTLILFFPSKVAWK